ncbi:uncharacterized protein N7496_008219 [Penicillium cataractarum]|uniref:Uncharacterized protein n=1 Tax=Penicillium cataractarum TaxID=2100454 RepID=A0A9W9RZV9_9EURO|nr:uncharacterized protein N7496_008219 [Penicillium cataractarum]KAJ5368459.1 hypothetical protein N7496_008219 [Penicillium cataractarum]
MKSKKAKTDAEPSGEHLSRRSSVFSLSFRFRGPGKRGSLIDPPVPQPTCVENVHYPVFNPQDLRHNTDPDYPMELFFRSESQTSPSDSERQTHGTPSFPRRSLYKARSGLLALRAGLFNRPSRPGSDPLESLAQSFPKKGHAQRHSHGFSNISSTTQEDPSFGTALYRNGRVKPRNLDDGNVDIIAQVSSHPLKNTMSAPQPMTSSCDLVDDLQPTLEQTVSTPADPSFVYQPYQHIAGTSHPSTEEGKCTEQEQHSSIVEDIQKDIADCVTPSVTSEDRYTTESMSCSSSDDEDLGGTILLCDEQNGIPEQRKHLLKSDLNHEEGTCKKIKELRHLSETRNNPSLEMEQIHMDSKESLELPDYSTPSIAGSVTPRRRDSNFIRPESSVKQERLLLGDDPLESQSRESPVSESRKCSVDVRIAFPGLYHDLLEQWVRETEVSPVIYPGFPGLESESTLKSAHLPSLPSPTSPLHNPDDHPYHPTELPWSLDTHFASGLVDIFNNFQKENTSRPFTSLARPQVVAVHSVRDSITLPCTMDDYTRHTDIQTTLSREGQSDRRRHSFGIHISERNESSSRDSTNPLSRREILRRSSEDQESPFNNPRLFSPPGFWGAADSQYDGSEFSTNYTQDSSAVNSANYTSPTSVSSAPWSPLDSPIDEEVLFRPTHRNEYYTADGKHSSYYPDRGDLQVKGRGGDGSTYYATRDDRGTRNGLRLTRESLTNTMRRSFRPDIQRDEQHEANEPTENATSSSRA